MERAHIITLAGKAGSGKSSTAREVAKLLGYEHISAGKMVRKMAEENGISLEELNDQARIDTTLDTKIDGYIKALGTKKNVVIDSRLGFYWIPNSFKVYLALDSEIAVARIFRDIEKDERKGEHSQSLDEVWDTVNTRTREERERFKRLYGIDPFNTKHYDLIIHTERNNPLTVALWIYDRYHEWLRGGTWHQVTEKVPLGYSEK